MNPIPQVPELKVPEQIKNIGENIGNSINQLKTNVNSSVEGFSEKTEAGLGSTSDFLQSNTIFAKFAFLLLAIILFVLLVSLGIFLIQYFMSPPKSPYLIKGLKNGNESAVFTQNPNSKDSIQILRSNNERTGLEFTWCFWLYINDLNTSSTMYQHIFNKGDNNYNSTTGIASVNNGPGVYIAPSSNVLHIMMDSSLPTDSNIVDISNVPIRNWFHVAIRLQNVVMDIYINGVISSRHILTNVPKQNYNDVYYAKNNGFSGNISNFRYYDYALNVFELNSIVSGGPDLNPSEKTETNMNTNFEYISNSWYNTKLNT
jgi:hypothetical protein